MGGGGCDRTGTFERKSKAYNNLFFVIFTSVVAVLMDCDCHYFTQHSHVSSNQGCQTHFH